MTPNRFAQLIKMAMARYGIRESDIRQAMLSFPGINGNPANFFSNYAKYRSELKAVKEVFGTTMVLTEEEEAKIERLSDLHALYKTFDNNAKDTFGKLTEELFDPDPLNGFAKVSMRLKEFWAHSPEREADIRAFISKLRKYFGFTLYDFPFTAFAKKFRASAPDDYVVIPLWSALIDVQAKLGGEYNMTIHSISANAVRHEVENLLRTNTQRHDGDVDRTVDALGRLYHYMVEDAHTGNREGASQLKMIITTVLTALKLKDGAASLSKFPAMAEFVKTGKMSGAVNRQTKALLIKTLTQVETNFRAMATARDFPTLQKHTLAFINGVTEVSKKAKGNSQVTSYVDTFVSAAFTRAASNKPHWMFIFYEVANDYAWLKEAMTKKGMYRHPAGAALIRKWGHYVNTKLGGSEEGADLAHLIREHLVSLADGTYHPDTFVTALQAILKVPGVGERMAREFLIALDRDADVLLQWVRGRIRNEQQKELLSQFIMKVVK